MKLSDSDHSQVCIKQSECVYEDFAIDQSVFRCEAITERIDSAERFIEPVTELGSLTKFVTSLSQSASATHPLKQVYLAVNR